MTYAVTVRMQEKAGVCGEFCPDDREEIETRLSVKTLGNPLFHVTATNKHTYSVLKFDYHPEVFLKPYEKQVWK